MTLLGLEARWFVLGFGVACGLLAVIGAAWLVMQSRRKP